METPKIFAATVIALEPSLVNAEVKKLDLKDMPLNPTPIEGVSSAMVSGNMQQAGVFGANAIMSEGSIFPPHTHPDARMSLVIEGTMYLGVGDTVDPGKEKAYEAGSMALTPAGVSHWMAARNGDVRVLEIGTGPTVTNWTAN